MTIQEKVDASIVLNHQLEVIRRMPKLRQSAYYMRLFPFVNRLKESEVNERVHQRLQAGIEI
ncbi:hypothetical protein P7H09_00120 [Paenibacillus larvae]|uniref:Uncharacterized protein n=1 Tax=Paenibacillus larvae TaxID=1464 RepID=A0AAP5JPP7_9BACL|nr:hypothetical protein [Paenibacillus larvae]MDT2249843.1 hypothetical protein [Paenibacillus larvae]